MALSLWIRVLATLVNQFQTRCTVNLGLRVVVVADGVVDHEHVGRLTGAGAADADERRLPPLSVMSSDFASPPRRSSCSGNTCWCAAS
jgi:hypothetical protein